MYLRGVFLRGVLREQKNFAQLSVKRHYTRTNEYSYEFTALVVKLTCTSTEYESTSSYMFSYQTTSITTAQSMLMIFFISTIVTTVIESQQQPTFQEMEGRRSEAQCERSRPQASTKRLSLRSCLRAPNECPL